MDISLIQNESLIKVADTIRNNMNIENKIEFPDGYIEQINSISQLLSEI